MSKKQITNYKFSPGVIPPAYNQYPNTVALLNANKAFLIAEVDAYIRQQIAANASNNSSPFYNYVYDTTKSTKCQRDTGYVLDGIIYDLTYGGNSLSYQIASNLFVNGVIQLQIPALEINVHTWLRGKIATNILFNTPYPALNSSISQVILSNNAETTGMTQTTTLFNITINAITSGLSTLPTVISPNSQNATLMSNTVGLIEENKKFIIEEVIAYINYNTVNNIAPFSTSYSYDQNKCRRDMSYVLEAYISDLKHSGNRQTVFIGSKYYINGVTQITGSGTPEVYAHTFLQNLVSDFVLQNTVYSSRQAIAAQVIDQGFTPETAGVTAFTTLSNIIINVLQPNGISTLPAVINTRSYVKFIGYYQIKNILLITNTTRNIIMYNFADNTYPVEVTYSQNYDSDFPAAQYGNDTVTTVTFNIDASSMMVTDNIQIFVEKEEQSVRFNPIATDAMERLKVGIPQSMIDADFEYGLQPTKWQTISMMRNYPSAYEIPGSDQTVVSVYSDASTGTSGTGASLISVTTVANHGFSVGTVFTIKALASSILGFSRAEGTFQVAAVPSSNVFQYYAKSKVGTVNPTLLSSAYTQLRTAAYYTGASVGTPSFNVYTNGQTGTLTTSLITMSGVNYIGFSGTAPLIGAPISGTGLNSGVQVTAVYGNGGTVTASTLITSANIGDTNITVNSSTGIIVGLVIDRGDGTAVQVTSITGTTLSLSGALTSAILGTNRTYTNLPQASTSGNGTGATFNVSTNTGGYIAQIGNSPGNGFVANDTITILGSSLGGATTANDATITITTASPVNAVDTFDPTTLAPGTMYTDATNVPTTGGTGTGLTVDITTSSGGVITVAVNSAGANYTVGDVVVITGGDGTATIQVLTVQAGGEIQSFTVSGSVVSTPSINFIGSIEISDVTNAQISSGNTGLTFTSIATIEIGFQSNHGFIPGDTITVAITSNGSNAQLASGAFFVEQVPTSTSLRYTARGPGIIANTLTGLVYSRPDSFYIHRPLDGGVQLGTASPSHGATAIRMSKKYLRYQSGKGIMYNTGALFAPSYDIQNITTTGTAIGSTITLTTDDTDHGCQVGAVITVIGVNTSGVNGQYTVTKIINERVLQFQATQTLGSSTISLGDPCQMSVKYWHGSSIRSGTFDDQNGMFWQYDGMRMALVRRASVFHLAGTLSVVPDSNAVVGVNTRFTSQLQTGDRIVIRGMSHVVSSITDDTHLTMTPDYRGVVAASNIKGTKTIDTIVPQEQWNIDPLNGQGPSGYNIDVTKMQMIGMQWTWYGAGFIDFMLRGNDGNYIFAHRYRNSNVNTEAYMRTGNLPVRYEVINEGAKARLASAITNTSTSLQLDNSYYFPSSGTVYIENELVSYTGNNTTTNTLTGLTRGTTLSLFTAGSQRSFSAGAAAAHSAGVGVILVSNTITPIISHWGSAFLLDGQFTTDRGYIFNYAATGVTASLSNTTTFLMRLSPSVSNAQTGDLGERELLNRAQLILSSISITSDAVSGGGAIVVQGILNPINYPTDPTKITWTGINSSAAGGQPSFVQIAPGGSVQWGGNVSTTTANVQGAFVTTLNARSFAPSTNSLTATSFSTVIQTANATSFNNTQTATVPAITSAQSPVYQFAFQTSRTDFLIPQSVYAAFTTPLAVGDKISVPTYVTGGQTISSITPSYITINSISYARIVMSAVANANSATNTAATVTFTTATAAVYNSAFSTSRNDFLIPDSSYTTFQSSTPLVVGDVISATTYVTGGQTVTGVTQGYIVIAGVSYTRIIMSAVANVSSPAASSNGSNNVSTSFTSSIAATYNSALSTSRSDFLITQSAYAASTIKNSDVLSATTYLTGSQTISNVTPSYATIGGVVYARVIMSGNATATSTAGTGNNVTVTSTSALTAAYASAFSTSRADFLVPDSEWAISGVAAGDALSLATYVTGGQSILSVTTGYTTIGGVSYTRVVMTAVANATSTSGAGNNQAVVVTATGTTSSYQKTNYLFFDSASWLASGATIGTYLATSVTSFPSGTSVVGLTTRQFGTSKLTVTGATNTGSTTTITYATQTAVPFAVGSSVTVSGITESGGSGSYNGTWVVTACTTSQVTMTNTGTTSYGSGGSITGATTYRVTFTQTSNASISSGTSITYQFGAAYATPGEQVFSFVNNPGTTDTLDLSQLKELTSSSIGGRGTFPNGPDVLAINIYKVSGSNTNANVIIRWQEAQA